MPQTIRATGLVWYRKSDWPRVRDIMADADKLPATFEKWLYAAEKAFNLMQKQGGIVEKVYLDPDEFPRWCEARGLNIDAKARTEFANDAVYRLHGRTH